MNKLYYMKGCDQRCKFGWMIKKLNPLGSNGKIVFSNLCWSYGHLLAECQESWENKVKRKSIQFNMNFMGQTD